MDLCLGPITNSFIDKLINVASTEIKKKKTKQKIVNNIINPLLKDISSRYYHYLVTLTTIMVIMIILLLSILTLLIIKNI